MKDNEIRQGTPRYQLTFSVVSNRPLSQNNGEVTFEKNKTENVYIIYFCDNYNSWHFLYSVSYPISKTGSVEFNQI